MITEDYVSFGTAKLLKEKVQEDEYEVIDEPRPDDKMISIIQQLITTARDVHSNPSLAKQYQDALDWFNKKVGYDRSKNTCKYC